MGYFIMAICKSEILGKKTKLEMKAMHTNAKGSVHTHQSWRKAGVYPLLSLKHLFIHHLF